MATHFGRNLQNDLAGWRSVFHKYMLGGDTTTPSGLYARLCHVLLVRDMLHISYEVIFAILKQKMHDF